MFRKLHFFSAYKLELNSTDKLELHSTEGVAMLSKGVRLEPKTIMKKEL